MDVNSKKPVGLGTNVSFSHGCFVDWASVPAGFDWVVICALRVVATNYQPLKEDPEGIVGLIPVSADDLNENCMALELLVTDLGKQLMFLSEQRVVHPRYGTGLITPMLVFARPEDPEAQAHGVLDIERMKAEDKFFEDGSVNLSS